MSIVNHHNCTARLGGTDYKPSHFAFHLRTTSPDRALCRTHVMALTASDDLAAATHEPKPGIAEKRRKLLNTRHWRSYSRHVAYTRAQLAILNAAWDQGLCDLSDRYEPQRRLKEWALYQSTQTGDPRDIITPEMLAANSPIS